MLYEYQSMSALRRLTNMWTVVLGLESMGFLLF